MRRDIESIISDLGRGSASTAALEHLERHARDLWGDEPKELELVVSELYRIHHKAGTGRTLTRVDNLLEALVNAAVNEQLNGAPANLPNTLRLDFVGHDTSPQLPQANDESGWKAFFESSHRTLRRVFSNQWERTRDNPDDEMPDSVEVELEIRAGKHTHPYVLSQLPAWSMTDARSLLGAARLVVDFEGANPPDNLPALLAAARPGHVGTPALNMFGQQVHNLAQMLDPTGPFCVDSVASLIRSFGAALAGAATGRKAALVAERDAIREAAKAAEAAGKSSDEVLALYGRAENIEEQIAALAEPEWTEQQAKDLGRLQTLLPSTADDPGCAEQGPERAWLMPLHPLVLRARYVRDRIYYDALQQLLDPARPLRDTQARLMDAFLDDCGQLSPPCEVLCPWTNAVTWAALRFQR